MKNDMSYNFENLKNRVMYSLENSDLDKINYVLFNINGPTLVSGVGGSSVVSEYASKILCSKNHIIVRNTEPRDFRYMDINMYKNVLCCSYSGNNYGVYLSLSNTLKHYLLTYNSTNQDNITSLVYKCNDIEHSFISLAATLIPCSILLNYYLENNYQLIYNLFNECSFSFDVNCDAYEIFTGIETSTPSKYLESTMIEAGIGIPVIHDKYSYCHGRSTLCTTKNNIAIYFDLETDLDKLLLQELPKYYKDVVIFKTDSSIISEYNLLIKCMYLTKYIAQSINRDISNVQYNPLVKKLYHYNENL